MKKNALLVFVCATLSVLSASTPSVQSGSLISNGRRFPNPSAKTTIPTSFVFEAEDALDYRFDNDFITIYGNYSESDESIFAEVVKNVEKTTIFYDLDLSDNGNSKLGILKNNAAIYSLKNGNPVKFVLSTNEIDRASLKTEISDFVNEKISTIRCFQATDFGPKKASSTSTGSFSEIWSSSFRKAKKPYGYIDIDLSIQKARINDDTSLYIAETHASFTPGSVATSLNVSGYEDYQNETGFLKVMP